MRLRPVLALACALAMGASAASAAPSARAAELARRYMAAMHMETMMGSMMANMAPAILDNVAKQSGAGAAPSDLRIAFSAAAEESMREMTPRMVEAMLPAIAETFTEAELEAAVTYYESPLGQALLAKSPAFMAKATPAVMALSPAIQADMQQRLCKKIGCDPATLK